MIMKPLGRTGLSVPLICLGTMTYGEQNTEAEGHAQMDYAFERGINFFDTAELYAIPPRPETSGATERIIGTWMKARGNRDKIFLASKVAGRSPMNWFRDSGEGSRVNKANIDEAIEKSLKRLQTDYIDLYQIHWPDRRVNMFGGWSYRDYKDDYTSFEEVLAALAPWVDKGVIRHIGVSNETAWGVMRFVQEAERNGLPRIATIQNAYNLVNRTFETGLAEVSMRENVGLLAYSPLAQGYLTGKYLGGARPPGARTTLFERGQRYQGPGAEPAIKSYIELAAAHGLTPVQLALKFCATREFMTSVIIGATTMEQLSHAIEAFDKPWTPELEAAVETLHSTIPNPCP
ncbi:aldo/keto reductase [Aquidulcibacter sp.]|uniref:aldo/keto reductase n=1 Tax=Aquidulcibacter sp. TaxID=2052990 RepID=UPI0025C713DF|nr:aldo/keto reductase [Aquidulcibacter sp.]MCA3692927.1 aldo/keto reductase [Aquidulcibacter sp.]